MPKDRPVAALVASCAAIFWPGALIFGFPGVMAPFWQAAFEVSQAQVGQSMFFVLAGAGSFMYLAGRWQERLGPGWLAALGGLLTRLATLGLGFAASIIAVYLWAFAVGVASALVIIPGLSAVQRFYPQRRGLVAGLVSMVFGLAAAPVSPLFSLLLAGLGYATLCWLLGLLALAVGLAAAPWLRFPSQAPVAGAGASGRSLTTSQSLGTASFWFLWTTWALGGAAGIAMVTLSTTFGLHQGLDISQAVLILTAFNLTNGLSRLVSGYVSDLAGRNLTMALTFAAAGLAYLALPHLPGLLAWAVLAAVVGLAFGSLFSVSIPLASDCFGLAHFGAVFGLVFTAYGFLSGALGPWLAGYLLDRTGGDFALVFGLLGVFFLISAVLIMFVRPPTRQAGP